jgi:Flp pilus assembly protein TadB
MVTEHSPEAQAVAPAPRTVRAGAVLNGPLAWAIAAVFGVLVVIAFVVALAAALIVGATVAVAALVLRLAPPRRRPEAGPTLLEGRRTPEGWVVEAALRR